MEGCTEALCLFCPVLTGCRHQASGGEACSLSATQDPHPAPLRLRGAGVLLSHCPAPSPPARMALHQLWSSCLVIYSLGLCMKGASFSGSFLLPSTLLLSCPPCTASFSVSGTFQFPLLGYTWEVGAGSPLQSQFLGLFSPNMTSALSGQALGSWALSFQAVFWVKEHSQEARESSVASWKARWWSWPCPFRIS